MAACEVVVVGQMKISTVEDRLHNGLGVEVKIKDGKRKPTKGDKTFGSIGARGVLKPFVVGYRSKKLKTIQADFREQYGAEIKLVFIDPETGKEADQKLSLRQLQDKYMNEEQRECFDCLESSPMFHFSLGSKELFHSNFIAWLGEAEPELFKALIKKWIKWQGAGKIAEIVDIKRENRNMDLWVEFIKSNSPDQKPSLLIIENKVKSIPTKQQLEDYAKKVKESKYEADLVLLTFSPLPKDEMTSGWKQCLYQDYLDWLKDGLSNVKSSYNRQIIEDYYEFTSAFYKLFRSVAESSLYSVNSEVYRRAKNLRIHDLFAKHQAEQLANKLMERSEKIFGGSTFKVRRKRDLNGEEGENIIIENIFLRGTPICSIFFNFNKDCFAGVQLDACDLRLAVCAPNNIAEDLTEAFWEKKWWNVDTEAFKESSITPKKRVNTKKYYEYKGKNKNGKETLFLYRVNKTFFGDGVHRSINDVAEKMLSHFLAVIKNKDEIENEIDRLFLPEKSK